MTKYLAICFLLAHCNNASFSGSTSVIKKLAGNKATTTENKDTELEEEVKNQTPLTVSHKIQCQEIEAGKFQDKIKIQCKLNKQIPSSTTPIVTWKAVSEAGTIIDTASIEVTTQNTTITLDRSTASKDFIIVDSDQDQLFFSVEDLDLEDYQPVEQPINQIEDVDQPIKGTIRKNLDLFVGTKHDAQCKHLAHIRRVNSKVGVIFTVFEDSEVTKLVLSKFCGLNHKNNQLILLKDGEILKTMNLLDDKLQIDMIFTPGLYELRFEATVPNTKNSRDSFYIEQIALDFKGQKPVVESEYLSR